MSIGRDIQKEMTAHNRPVRVLISFLSREVLSAIKPTFARTAESRRSLQKDGFKMPQS